MTGDGKRHNGERIRWYRKPFLSHPIPSGLIATVVGGLIIAGAVAIFSHWSKQAPPSDEQRISELATGTTVNYFRKTLGSKEEIRREIRKGWNELIWMKEEYAVQAFANSAASVQGYSVTTHSHEFLPAISGFNATLGVSTFGQVLGKNARVMNTYTPFGPDWRYSEALPGSGPSHYKTYIMTDSFAGRNVGQHQGLELAIVSSSSNEGCAENLRWCPRPDRPKVEQLRRKAIVTTFTVLGPGMGLEDLPKHFNLGPTFADEELVIR